MKKLIALAALAGAGYVLWQKSQERKQEEELWTEAVSYSEQNAAEQQAPDLR